MQNVIRVAAIYARLEGSATPRAGGAALVYFASPDTGAAVALVGMEREPR